MSKEARMQNADFFDGIQSILAEARRKAYTSVNFIMVETYWRIGRRIVEEEQGGQAKAVYGKELIKELSKRLGDEFGKGFSVANLKNFRQFYQTFPELEKSYALRSQLSWTHYRLIMRVEDARARDYYMTEAADQGWSSRHLERQIKTMTFQRLLSAPPDSGGKESSARIPRPESLLKDPYILEFLNLPDDPSPHEKNIGQMDMYVRMFDDLKRGTDDNPTLGIILCADKDETVVHYSVLNDSEQMFASKYLSVLPSEEELARELEARHVLEIETEGGER
jgi:hypothetical protein